jgi:hypothetical protein
MAQPCLVNGRVQRAADVPGLDGCWASGRSSCDKPAAHRPEPATQELFRHVGACEGVVRRRGQTQGALGPPNVLLCGRAARE